MRNREEGSMKLTEESIEFAKKHIMKYTDSDFYPRSPIFETLWKVWPQIKSYLLSTEICDFETRIPKIFAAPKSKGGYRIVHRLEPMNAIIYTALAYMIADKIEAARMPKEQKTACSYRISTTSDGDFFGNEKDYNNYYDKSKELSTKYQYILQTDITDFYNQIYVHRLQNAIEAADSSLRELSYEIEDFIIKLNSSSTKGIPVGPIASIVFSEALMIDIDNFISNKGFEFTRYVDDIRIFSNNQKDLDKILEELTQYLYEQHRLNLSSSKTGIFEINDFLNNELNSPEEMEIQERHKFLLEVTEEMAELLDYPNFAFENIELEDLPNEKQIRIKYKALYELLLQIINTKKFNLGLVRHILKQARHWRCRSIIKLVIDNLSFFTPVIREACLYFDNVITKDLIETHKEYILNVLINSEAMNKEFVKYWINWLITKNINYFDKVFFQNYLKTQDLFWEIRKNIYLKNITFINTLKINYDNYDIWTRLEILQGIQLLPKKEKNAFLASRGNGMKTTEDFLIKAINSMN